MYCPDCQFQTEVFNSRPLKDYQWRRRICPNCKKKFTTFEIISPTKGVKGVEKLITENTKIIDKIKVLGMAVELLCENIKDLT